MKECERPVETVGLRRRPPSFLTTVAVVSVCSCYDYSYTLPSPSPLRSASPYVWFSARCGSSLLLCQMLPLSKWALTGRTTRFGTISWLSNPPCIGYCIGVAANENEQKDYTWPKSGRVHCQRVPSDAASGMCHRCESQARDSHSKDTGQ